MRISVGHDRFAGRQSDHGGRMGEREHGRSRDGGAPEASGRRGQGGQSQGHNRDRSSDSGFRSERPAARYPSGPLPPMGSSGLPLSPSQGPIPGGVISTHAPIFAWLYALIEVPGFSDRMY